MFFCFTPVFWGKWSILTCAYFVKWVGEKPPTGFVYLFCFGHTRWWQPEIQRVTCWGNGSWNPMAFAGFPYMLGGACRISDNQQYYEAEGTNTLISLWELHQTNVRIFWIPLRWDCVWLRYLMRFEGAATWIFWGQYKVVPRSSDMGKWPKVNGQLVNGQLGS